MRAVVAALAFVACCVALVIGCSGGSSSGGTEQDSGWESSDSGPCDCAVDGGQDATQSIDAGADRTSTDALLDVERSDVSDGGAGDADSTADGSTGDGAGAADGTADSSTQDSAGTVDSTVDVASEGPAGDSQSSVDATSPADAGVGGGEGGGIVTEPVCDPPCPSGYKRCDVSSGPNGVGGFPAGACAPIAGQRYGCSASSCAPCFVSTAPHGESGCSAGACAIASCNPGWMDCNGIVSDGCETSVETAANCGTCGNACPSGQVCNAGACVAACTPPLTACNGDCANLVSDPQYCGGCTSPCGDALGFVATCTNASCNLTCMPGLTYCAGVGCLDTQSDPLNCGPSCNPCPAIAGGLSWCQNGTCITQCPAGLTACGDECTDTTLDPFNCGNCGTTCTGLCINSACLPALPSTVGTAGNAISLSVDDSYVYWVDSTNGSIVEADKTAAMPTAIVLSTGEPQPHVVASDGAFVYWSDYLGGAVMRKPRTGASSDTVVAASVQPDAIAVDGSYAYWAEPPSGNPLIQLVRRAPKDGSGTGQMVLSWDTRAGTNHITSLAVDSTNLCWGGSYGGGCMPKNAVATCSGSTCTGASVSFLGGGASNVTTDGAFVVAGGAGFQIGGHTAVGISSYWYSSAGLSQSVGLWGGEDTATQSVGYYGSTQDPRFAYFSTTSRWLTGNQAGLFREHKCSSATYTLSTLTPTSLVADEHYVYGINGGTTIVRFPK